jgi:sialic acid synthase SpsE
MDVAAVALGANLVEKTITEDRTTRGVEHSMSIEPPEMTKFVEQIRYLEVAMGDNRRSLSSQEIEKRTAVRRSVFMRSHGLKGQKVSDCDIEFRRPGYGIPPSDFDRIEDAVLTCDVSAGEMLNWSDIGMSE